MTREEAIKKAINILVYVEAHIAKSKEAREEVVNIIEALEQEPKAGQYEKHIDHTDCIWYSNRKSRCPVTCSQYRDGWNDAMDYIFKNGKGYQPYRRNV